MSEFDDIISGGSSGVLDSNGQPQAIPSGFSAETAENDGTVNLPLSHSLSLSRLARELIE